MKKVLFVFLIALFCLTESAFCAGNVTFDAPVSLGNNAYRMTLTAVADATAATFPEATSTAIHGYIVRVVVIPGAVTPTSGTDMDLDDEQGCDVMGSAMDNFTVSADSQYIPAFNGGFAYGGAFVSGKLTSQITGNSVNSAALTAYIYYEK